MAKELSESRIALIKMFQEADKREELLERKERINAKVMEYQKELNEIIDRAYERAVGIVVAKYREMLNNSELSEDERAALEQERKDFEADPSTKGVIREKCPIVDPQDQERALQITELLKDTDKLGDVKEPDFMDMMQGFAERNKPKEPAWMRDLSKE